MGSKRLLMIPQPGLFGAPTEAVLSYLEKQACHGRKLRPTSLRASPNDLWWATRVIRSSWECLLRVESSRRLADFLNLDHATRRRSQTIVPFLPHGVPDLPAES